jgi:hypothetical protein
MSFIKGFFRHEDKPVPPPLPLGVAQTQAELDTTRKIVEAEVAADRQRRGATDKRP